MMSISYLILNRTSRQLTPEAEPDIRIKPVEQFTFYPSAFNTDTLSICHRHVRVVHPPRHHVGKKKVEIHEYFAMEGTATTICLTLLGKVRGDAGHAFHFKDKIRATFSLTAQSAEIPNLWANILTVKQFQEGINWPGRWTIIKASTMEPYRLVKERFSLAFSQAIAGEKGAGQLHGSHISFVFMIDEHPPDMKINTLFSRTQLHLQQCQI
ncbi:MAG: hypothetical protein KDK65_04835, partial [Chlamydiia bacterium]|nr:hypothetical protein [Chlamydiia bacterium]